MKKAYQKPEILFESFASSTNIAAGCGTIILHDVGGCAYQVKAAGGAITYDVFTSEYGVCTTKEAVLDGVADGAYNGICYHVPVGGSTFNS